MSQFGLHMVYLWPKGFNLDAYGLMVKDANIWRTLFNTILYAVCNTLLMIITSLLLAYPLSNKHLLGRKWLNLYLLIPMYVSGGLIPTFLVILKLGMYDSPLALILPGCFSIWNAILVKSFISSIPEGLTEAAQIDGTDVWTSLWYIVLPLSTPVLAVIAISTIVGVWNNWFSASVYLPHDTWHPLQLYLRNILDANETMATMLSIEESERAAALELANAQLKYAMILFSSLPVLCSYPFFQKYFEKGMMLGSLKG